MSGELPPTEGLVMDYSGMTPYTSHHLQLNQQHHGLQQSNPDRQRRVVSRKHSAGVQLSSTVPTSGSGWYS